MLFTLKDKLDGSKKSIAATALTPQIKQSYTDFELVDYHSSESTGYFEFQAKSSKNAELHYIRALNLGSELAKRSPNTAITLFLQEMLRFCSLNASAILLDTLEFHEQKICYAIKHQCTSIISQPEKPSTLRLDIPRLLKQTLLDLEQICSAHHGKFHLLLPRIYHIEKLNPPVYFLHDWAQIISAVRDPTPKDLSDTTLSLSMSEEKEHVYNLALQILGLYGVQSEEIQKIKEVSPSFYESILDVAVRNNKNLGSYLDSKAKEIILKMLERDEVNRLSIQQVVEAVNSIGKEEEEKISENNFHVNTSEQIKLTIQESIQKMKETEIKGLEIVSWEETEIKTVCFKPKERNWERQSGRLLSKIVNPSNDKRVRFTTTDVFPHSVHGIVISSKPDGTSIWGTGVMIAPDIVLTAAYNLYNDEKPIRNPYQNIKFIPGLNGKQAPFGSFDAFEVYAPEDFVNNRSSHEFGFDPESYGIMVLKEPIGEKTGYFGLHIAEKNTLKSKGISVVGYPGDKSRQEGYYEQWGETGQILAFEDKNFVHYQITTYSGQGGSAVFYQASDHEYYVIGIHLGSNEEYKTGTWINRERFDQIQQWVKQSRQKKKSGGQGLALADQNLITLDLEKTLIGEIGVSMLIKSEINQLEALNLEANQLTSKAAADLALAKLWPQLQSLNLASNLIGDIGVSHISMNSVWMNLRTLNLSSNSITDKGAADLSANTTWKKLMILDLGHNLISKKGATELGKNSTWINLETLILQFNLIDDTGAEGLSQNKHWKKLKNLFLLGNSIQISNVDYLMNHAYWAAPLNIIM